MKTTREDRETYPEFRSHYWPRTGTGRAVLIVFLVLFFLTQPPIVNGPVNRIEPFIFGMPFLYVYLLAAYVSLILVLIFAQRRNL